MTKQNETRSADTGKVTREREILGWELIEKTKAKSIDFNAVNDLIRSGAEVNLQNEDGKTALMNIARKGEEEAVKVIRAISEWAGLITIATLVGAFTGTLDWAAIFIGFIAALPLVQIPNEIKEWRKASINRLEAVADLIDAGAKVKIPDNENRTAMDGAKGRGVRNLLRQAARDEELMIPEEIKQGSGQ